MANSFFKFKEFIVHQDRCAMKVSTDGCLFGSWTVGQLDSSTVGQLGRLAVGQSAVQGQIDVLDIGTGTGLLALMIAQKISNARIDAIEIDEEAYRQAKENVKASPWPDRINVMHADAGKFESLHKYDIIISNPPFYEKELKSDDARKNLAHHEGLRISELIGVIKKLLKPEGKFYLLLPYKRSKEIRELMLQHEIYVNQIVFVRQSVNHDYFRMMLEGSFGKGELAETKIDELPIKDENQVYTKRFIELLKDYYLNI